jgi:flagellar protein FliL
MAKENSAQEQSTAPAATPAAAHPAVSATGSSISIKNLVFIGIPVFLVQLIVVFFLASKIFGGQTASSHEQVPVEETEASTQEHMYIIKDIIINPAGTNGGRFLLTTIGMEVSTLEAQAELEKKELQVRDVLNSILTGKSIVELVDVTQREALRTEISKGISALLKTGKMKNVYFSKYIIQ